MSFGCEWEKRKAVWTSSRTHKKQKMCVLQESVIFILFWSTNELEKNVLKALNTNRKDI